MRLADTVVSVLADHHLNAVLVDVGASGDAPEIWGSLAPRATYVGFDPDLREMRTDTRGTFRTSIIINRAVCVDQGGASVPFYLTDSPYCSSILQPNERALSKYSFAPLFRVVRKVSVPTTTLTAVVNEQALGQIDWLKIDAQGADLRVYDSLTPELRSRLLAVDTEPGVMDAYQNEDLFIEVHRRLCDEGFWLSHIQIRGVPRISETVLTELGITTRSGTLDPARGYLRPSPGWCEARYLRTVESMRDMGLGNREYVLAWAFATVDAQHGHALEVARAMKTDLHQHALGERLWSSASDAIRSQGTDAKSAPARFLASVWKQPTRRLLSNLLVVLIAVLWLLHVGSANVDLTEGRHVLFMDEMVVHDETTKIIRASSIRELWKALIGNDQRYGRTLWYVAAIASEIPERIFGERGQIVATRMALACCLLVACLVFTYTWIRSDLLRPLSFFAFLTVPATAYFATMPKPEPVQMLFLAIFLWMFLLRGSSARSWTLFGAAFGTKINVLVLGPLFAAFWWLHRRATTGISIKAVASSCAWFILGFFLTVPVVLTGIGGARSYAWWTFRNVGHGSDDPDIGPIDWLRFMVVDVFWGPGILRFGFAFTILALPIALIVRRGKQSVGEPAVALYACGIALVLSIAFGVDRLWGHYLYPGLLLLYVAAFASIERLLHVGTNARRIAFVALAIAMLASGANAVRQLEELSQISRRTSQPEHVRKLEEYDRVMKSLSELAARKNDVLRVAISPHMYRPTTTSAWVITPFWGPFLRWRDNYDAIVLYRWETAESDVSSNNPQTQDQLALSRQAYLEHTAEQCTNEPCYNVLPLLGGDIKILVKRRD